MSSSNDFDFSVALQDSVLSDELNSTLLYIFLMGIYTAISICTIYFYIYRKQGRSTIVICALLALTSTSIAYIAIQWKLLNICFINNAQSMFSTFLCNLEQEGTAFSLSLSILGDVQSMVADGLLVWRCYHLANQSFLSIKVPLFFFSLEIVIGIVAMTANGVAMLRDFSSKSPEITNIIYVFFFAITALTTISSTIFICHRIARSTSKTRHTKRYRKIMMFAIESSVIYSVASVLNVIVNIIGFASNNLALSVTFDSYVSAFASIMTVLAPTLMIAQISLSSNPPSIVVDNTLPISSLHFGHQVTEDDSSTAAQHSSMTSGPGTDNTGKEHV